MNSTAVCRMPGYDKNLAGFYGRPLTCQAKETRQCNESKEIDYRPDLMRTRTPSQLLLASSLREFHNRTERLLESKYNELIDAVSIQLEQLIIKHKFRVRCNLRQLADLLLLEYIEQRKRTDEQRADYLNISRTAYVNSYQKRWAHFEQCLKPFKIT